MQPWPAPGLWQRFSSGDGDGSRTGDFSSFVAWPKGYLETPWAALPSLQRQIPHRQRHPPRDCCCLLLPALGNIQLLLGKLAKHWETRKAMPLPGEHSSQLLTQQHLCAVLTYHLPIPGGLAPSPSTSAGSYSWKHPGVTFNHAFAC